MKRLLIGAGLAVMMSFAFAAVASAQSFVDPNAQAGAQCPSGLLPEGDPSTGLYCFTPQDLQNRANLQPGDVATVPGGAVYPGATSAPITTTTAPAPQQIATTVVPTTTPAASTSTTAALPNTGGPITLLLPAAALLIGGGLLAFGISRRK